MESGYVGRPLKRVEDPRLVRGEGRYVDDLREPGTLHVVFVRGQHAHARILGIDARAALAMPGVVGVFTAVDLQGLRPLPGRPTAPDARPMLAPLLAGERVRFAGEPLAVVVAETRAQAEDAARAVEVAYEPLPAAPTAEAAAAPDAPRLHPELPDNVCFRLSQAGGDVDGAFARAAHVVRVRAHHHRIAPVPLETRAVLARPEADGGLTVWASSQVPHRYRDALATTLDLPRERIRVVTPDVGGAFGAKGPAYREDATIAALALRVGRPLKWVATRMEDLLSTHHARDQVDEAEAALDVDGRILAIRTRTLAGLGAYFHHSDNTKQALRIPAFGTGAYRVPALASDVLAVFTNANPTGPYRGAGRPEAAFLVERLVDAAARQLGLDPAELRRRNALRPDDFPYTTPTGTPYDSGDYPALLERALALADYEGLRAEQRARRAQGELVGIGLALFVETTAAGDESGLVRVEADGRIVGASGAHSHGQGHETAFAQLLADEFGVPFEQVTILHGDTALVPTGGGTFGSRSLALGGSALALAAREVKEQLRGAAARLLEAAPGDLEVTDGAVRVRGAPSASGGTLAEVVAAGAADGRRFEAFVHYEAPGDAISSGAYVVMASVDPETGRIDLERLVAVDDCGVVVNPRLVAGQVHGGVVQGIGEALFERMVYDEAGQVVTASLLDYAVPTARGLPPFVLGHVETPSPSNPLGAKGAGEAGTIGAPPAIVNAVLDALAPLGVRELDLPLHPERVWRALRETISPQSTQRAQSS